MSENTFVVPVVPVPSPQCIDVDEVHAGNRLSLMVTPGVSEEWVRNIATEFTPKIGQTFATLDEGIQFYETYAIACGFEPRKSSTKRFRSSGDIRTKLIVCHREGFRDSKPTILPITGEDEEPMVKASNPKKTKVTRIGCKARIFFRFVIKEIDQVQVPLFLVDQFHAAHNHHLSPLKYREFQKKCPSRNMLASYENIGASLTEFKNFGREIKCFIGLKDAQMFVDQLEHLHETEEGFYFAYDIDQNKCLFRSPALFTIAAHRYCMWHIMKKLLEKVGTTLTKETDFVTPERQRWIPAYYRDIPLGCLLRTTQRSESANSFFKRFENPHGTLVEFWMRFQSAMDQQRYTQKSLDRDSDHSLPQTKTLLSLECVDSLNSCSAGDSLREGSTRLLEVEDFIFNKTYTVAFNPSTFDETCSCKLFERKGYI
ncbi:protein FAR1-RELATED SEQUENCE 5-like [Silene latifolia]|uniref:protein FAR1-RELATED SEQUENCE 5-like n=1 Tax=Silene latifolia TaxID=37657 RepID=UPI003D7701EA